MESSTRKRAGNMYDRPRTESAVSRAQGDGIALLTGKPFTVGGLVGRECPIDKRVKVDGKSVRVPNATGERVFRTHNACVFCGASIVFHNSLIGPAIGRAEMDRIAAGEAYKPANLQPACRSCNAARGNMSVEAFVDRYAGKSHLIAMAAAEAMR